MAVLSCDPRLAVPSVVHVVGNVTEGRNTLLMSRKKWWASWAAVGSYSRPPTIGLYGARAKIAMSLSRLLHRAPCIERGRTFIPAGQFRNREELANFALAPYISSS